MILIIFYDPINYLDHVQGRSEEYGEYADYEYEYEEDGSKKRRKKRQAPTGKIYIIKGNSYRFQFSK